MKKKNQTKGLLRRMQTKLWVAFLVVCLLFTGLIGRIMYIQYTSGAKYEKQVLSQMSYDSKVIPYKRGDIVDTNGTVIATSIDVYSLILDCFLLNNDKDHIDSTIGHVRRYFPQIEENAIKDALKDSPESRYVQLLKEIPYEDMTAFNEVINGKDTKKEITGLWFEKNFKRVYPYNNLASDVIGFASATGGGAIGLENNYNDVLSGINGRTYGYLDNDSTRERRTEKAKDGNTLVTTIDINIQSILEREIESFNKRLGGESGKGSLRTAALIMNPKNGEIYAMADYPSFDLNNPRDLSAWFSPEELEAMSPEDKLSHMNKIWRNFCVADTFEPGSTFKPFTVATGLECGSITGNEVYFCNGGEQFTDHFVRCVNRNGHGQETVEDSLKDSCNDALMQMSYKIGAHNFAYFQRLFGFGQRTNVDITGEARTDTLIYNEKQLGSTINLATNSFGQNFNVTMIQLASAFASLVNGGYLYEPHVVRAIEDSSGAIISETDAVIEKITVSKETSEKIKGYLKAVVASGTGKTAGVEGYSIGGKTGTAEKRPRGQGRYLVSFIGFAPVEDPELLIYMVVDEPAVADQAHSSFAQEIVHSVLEQILPYMGIAKEVENAEEIQ